MATRKNVGGNEVRAWAKSEAGQAFLADWAAKADKDVPTVGERGRFAKDLVDAFHAANKKARYTANHVETRKISGIRETSNGRKIPVTVTATLAEVRAFAKAEGMPIGDRGRVSKDVYAAFAARPKVTA